VHVGWHHHHHPKCRQTCVRNSHLSACITQQCVCWLAWGKSMLAKAASPYCGEGARKRRLLYRQQSQADICLLVDSQDSAQCGTYGRMQNLPSSKNQHGYSTEEDTKKFEVLSCWSSQRTSGRNLCACAPIATRMQSTMSSTCREHPMKACWFRQDCAYNACTIQAGL